MPQEGFSFFEIQTLPENLTPRKPKGPPESCKFWYPLYFSDPKCPPPPPLHYLGGGLSYDVTLSTVKFL